MGMAAVAVEAGGAIRGAAARHAGAPPLGAGAPPHVAEAAVPAPGGAAATPAAVSRKEEDEGDERVVGIPFVEGG